MLKKFTHLIIPILLLNLYGKSQTDSAFIEIPYIQNPRKTYAKYYISLPDSFKNGAYTRFTMWQQIAAEGRYKNDKKTGIWKYYDDYGKLIYTLDHGTHEVLYISTTCNSLPVYFGDELDRRMYIQKKINELFSSDEQKELNGKEYNVHFKIDENGKPFEVETRWYYKERPFPITPTEQKLIQLIQEMPNWIVFDKKKAPFSFNCPIKFTSK